MKVPDINKPEVKRIPTTEEPQYTTQDMEKVRSTMYHLKAKKLIADERRRLGDKEYNRRLNERLRGS